MDHSLFLTELHICACLCMPAWKDRMQKTLGCSRWVNSEYLKYIYIYMTCTLNELYEPQINVLWFN